MRIIKVIYFFALFFSLIVLGFTVQKLIELTNQVDDYQNKYTIKLGNERLIEEYNSIIDNKNIGIITNQTGIDSKGVKTYEKLLNYKKTNVLALFAPEHGIDGSIQAGDYVQSYILTDYNIPIYSLYGETRRPTAEMLNGIDVLIYDIQDIGARSYTFISTLYYCMEEALKLGIKVVVLDRPNPVNANLVEGFVMEDTFKSFVGIDNLPYLYGMTVGEISRYFNRNIGCDLIVVPMKNYNRDLSYNDLNIIWLPTSPRIPDITSAILYGATGINEGIKGLSMDDNFKWIGGEGINSIEFADKLNMLKLKGVEFIAEDRDKGGGVRIKITNKKIFNPYITGLNITVVANDLITLQFPEFDANNISMSEKIMGTQTLITMLKEHRSINEIVDSYQSKLNEFKLIRLKYLLY